MAKKKRSKKGMSTWFARTIYLVAGAVGVGSALWAGLNWDIFLDMGIVPNIAFGVAVIASVNWLPVGVTGDRNKDIFGLLGL